MTIEDPDRPAPRSLFHWSRSFIWKASFGIYKSRNQDSFMISSVMMSLNAENHIFLVSLVYI